ncbi:MAG: hypothetical protein LBU32_09580 [Clostridiales bacterium]|nr:hypothetical protein [Clostridiales bacterium]
MARAEKISFFDPFPANALGSLRRDPPAREKASPLLERLAAGGRTAPGSSNHAQQEGFS